MTRFKFFTYLMPLAIAGGLALGLAAAPAMADPPPHHHGGSEDATLFTVTLNFLSSVPGGTPAGACTGTTDIQANPGLQVLMIFDEGCSVSMTVDSDPVELHPFSLEVKTKKEVTVVRLYFTTSTVFLPVPNDTVYVTDFLFASIIPDIFFLGKFDLTPVTDETNGETLTKIHRPDKGAETDGGVLIGSFTYTPIP